jgi:queuine/archaeosine tRNA-ribosyltransferase
MARMSDAVPGKLKADHPIYCLPIGRLKLLLLAVLHEGVDGTGRLKAEIKAQQLDLMTMFP